MMPSELQQLQDMYGPEDLDPELVPYLAEGRLGQGLFHPLVHDPMYVAVKNRIINRSYRHKLELLAEHVAENNWYGFVFLHERPYRLDAVTEVVFRHWVTVPETVWPLIGAAWTDSENIWQNFDQWRDLWSLDDLDNDVVVERRELVMSEEERALLAAMPDTLTVYRGTSKPDLNGEGLSWTVNRAKAEWFARRYIREDDTPTVIAGTVKKCDVLAYFTGRGESEMVVFPEYVTVERHEEI